MPYTADINRANPACFLFLIDQSLSMSNPLGSLPGKPPGPPKMNAAADAINHIMDSLAQRCSQGMEVRDYFDIGILGYGFRQEMPYQEIIALEYINYYDDRENVVQRIRGREYNPNRHKPVYRELVISTLPGTTPERPFLSISRVVDVSELEERKVIERDISENVVEVTRRFPVWLRPHAGIGTPVCRALNVASQSVAQWIQGHQDSFPPIIINIGDGEATDGDPEPAARDIMNLRTRDGNVLIFNCHLSETASYPRQYPDQEADLPDAYARQMFRMSSVLPPAFMQHAASLEIPVGELSRGYIFNADMVSLVQFLDIGTRGPSNLR